MSQRRHIDWREQPFFACIMQHTRYPDLRAPRDKPKQALLYSILQANCRPCYYLQWYLNIFDELFHFTAGVYFYIYTEYKGSDSRPLRSRKEDFN